MYVKNKSR